MIKRLLKAIKAFIRNRCVVALKTAAHDEPTRKWAERLNLKLVYAILFFAVVERVYFRWASLTLDALMTPNPLIRSEQFTLSLLIHYPQFVLWGVIAGLLAVLVLNFLVVNWLEWAKVMYPRITRRQQADSGQIRQEKTRD